MSATPTVREMWLARRLRKHSREVRWTGVSSNALAAYAVGVGPRPIVPGTPTSRNAWHGDECGHQFPHDEGDLLACTITYLTAPDDECRARMLPVLTEFEQWVWHGINRYGDKVSRGSRDLAADADYDSKQTRPGHGVDS